MYGYKAPLQSLHLVVGDCTFLPAGSIPAICINKKEVLRFTLDLSGVLKSKEVLRNG